VATGWPHFLQNFAPSWLAVPHPGQAVETSGTLHPIFTSQVGNGRNGGRTSLVSTPTVNNGLDGSRLRFYAYPFVL
jgi:hypothetical protein